jgi:glycosyltransferase involved in cell wall biosynthesis
MTRIVGSVLVRNEDVFVAQSIRNVAAFCDRIHAVDHVSTDRTWEILRELSRELDHLEVRRAHNAAVAHRLLAAYAGTDTWVLGVDGDELYDPGGLERLRADLLAGAHAEVFRVKAHVLNCDELDLGGGTAAGWLAPPSRPITKLFNFGAVESWPESPDPLQAGNVVFRAGHHWESRKDLADRTSWQIDPLRCLHVCFLPRSSRDASETRRNLDESGEYDRGPVGTLKRVLRPAKRSTADAGWKRDWYARGERVTIDARPFFGR